MRTIFKRVKLYVWLWGFTIRHISRYRAVGYWIMPPSADRDTVQK